MWPDQQGGSAEVLANAATASRRQHGVHLKTTTFGVAVQLLEGTGKNAGYGKAWVRLHSQKIEGTDVAAVEGRLESRRAMSHSP